MEGWQASRRAGLAKTLGPGIMYAGAAIGVSHLVQSTRAGAGYGFSLVWVVVLVHLVKYPFFEFGHRYTAATGDNLLVGYRRIGRWALLTYLLVALALSVPSVAVLTVVTAGMASQMLNVDLASTSWMLGLLALCAVVLASGGYPALDKLMKLLMAFLAVCTLVAVVAAVGHGRVAAPKFEAPDVWNDVGIAFLVALMGWMPTPVDASVFPSVWMQERKKQTGHKPTMRQALFDFKLGYFGSLVMATAFLSLGALVMFGAGDPLAGSGADFAAQFVSMYVGALGAWSRPIVMTAALITMLSTLLTVMDAYPRVLTVGCRVAWPQAEKLARAPYWAFLVVMVAGALLIFEYLTSHMRTLVDAVATIAFLSAPLFGYLNYRAIFGAGLPKGAAPPQWLKVLSWTGLAFLIGFSILYLVMRLRYAS
ncbi:MAG: NRAMP family divalent metal transporter [Planctomycetota bacterium]|jgi:Mn2+/Fe2+ NRAMP family transporter